MSLLSLIQKVTDRVGLARPSVVVTSTDTQVRQLLALANEEGAELANSFPWQALTTEWTFITSASAVQSNQPIATDFDRFIPDSFFNRTTARKLIGPITPQEWQRQQAFPVLTEPYIAFRERDGSFLVSPTPTAGQTIAYEYVSAYWAKSSADQAKVEFTSDDDGTYLDENLMALGLRWRWKQAKGLDYAEDMATYERNLERLKGADGGARALSLTPGLEGVGMLGLNVPDGNWTL